MTAQRFQDIWKEQCLAGRRVRTEHGVLSALDYLIGEKLQTYAETASERPEFAQELPRFVAEIRDIFDSEEIRLYLDHIERLEAIEEEQVSTDEAHKEIDGLFTECSEHASARHERFLLLKDLLTSPVLGTA